MEPNVAVAAIVGLVGIWATIHVARRQIQARIILGERTKWIGTLRDCIAEFQSSVMLAATRSELPLEHRDALESIMALYNKIGLMINPLEDDHLELYKLLGNAVAHLKDNTSEPFPKISTIIADITTAAQKILKREWERVKAGK